jgi:hypothetical protein
VVKLLNKDVLACRGRDHDLYGVSMQFGSVLKVMWLVSLALVNLQAKLMTLIVRGSADIKLMPVDVGPLI